MSATDKVSFVFAVFAASAALCAHARVLVDAASSPEGAAYLAERGIVETLERNIPVVAALLDGEDAAREPVADITLRFADRFEDSSVAALANASERYIVLGLDWAKGSSDEEVNGALAHEYSHIHQNYVGKRPPSWLSEGIADWVRWCRIESAERRAPLEREAASDRRHNASYRVTALFLDWICRTKDPGFVMKLNRICRAGEYDGEKTWIELTGKPQEVLAAEWRRTLPPRPRPKGAIELATYNIRRAGKPDVNEREWSRRLPLIVDLVGARGFEIMGLQEAFPGQIEDLRAALPGWDSFGAGRSKELKDEASPIFWKKDRFEKLDGGQFWMSETPDTPGSKSWKAMFPRICTWVKFRDRSTGREFFHFNCHTDHASIEARRNGVRVILERIAAIAGDAPVVLTGDFNDEEVNDALRQKVFRKDHTRLSPRGADHPINIVKSVLKDSIDVSRTPHVGTRWTDNGYGEKHVKRIDYVFVSDGVDVLAHETCCDRPGGLYPSDHEALATTLRLR